MAASATTQLARVADSSPLLLSLRYAHKDVDKVPPSQRIAVKIRPTLLHFLVCGRLWCVIRSKVPIADVADYGTDHEGGEARHKLLVSTTDGDVWVVTLPGHFRPGAGVVTRELLLERSTSNSEGGFVQWFCQLPGVQSVRCAPVGSGLTSLTLMGSVVTPSTLIVSTRGSSKSKLQRHQSLELDEIEGEQSTCTLCLNSQEMRYRGLLQSLFPEVVNYSAVAAILQGDLDGQVRFCLVRYPSAKGDAAKASVIRSGTLLRLDEPVQMIIPFMSFVPPTPLLEGDQISTSGFDALLVLGTRGKMGIVELKDGYSADNLPVSFTQLGLGRVVQSLLFVNSVAAFVFCSEGSAFVFRSADLLAKAQAAERKGNNASSDGCMICAEKLPVQPGIVRLIIDANTQGILILFASGRLAAIDEAAFRTMVTSVLPLPKQSGNQNCQGISSKTTSESRVRNLLHRIAQISTESTALRAQSKQMDHQLKTLHSALEMLQAVESAGVESVIKCELKASMVITGTFSDRQTIRLECSLRFTNPDTIVSFDDWLLCLYVRTRELVVTTYSFPLKDVSTDVELSIIVDPDTLAQQDLGSLWVSCSVLFCSSGSRCPESEHKFDSKAIDQEDPLSFAIPLLQDRKFLLAQLSRPVEEEIPVSQVVIQAAFRQDHEPSLPVGRANEEGKASSSALWSGVQWWTALADHARKNPSFAALWSKIAPPDATPLELSPPSRFVISIPSFFSTEDDDEDDEDEDEDFEKVRVEKMVSFLRLLLEVPIDEVPRLRRSCRTQNGKLWAVLRAFSGSLILLRFTPSEGQQRSVDIAIQCSDVADLSAMRCLVLETINNWNDNAPLGFSEEDRSEELALDMSEMLKPIAALEGLVEDLTLKTAKIIEDPKSASCTDEVLHALAQLAHLENQTLTLYWKTRLLLNKTIM